MSFQESLAFEIACTQSELDELEAKRKKLKKRLRDLSKFLEELSARNPKPESESDNGQI